ncbi:ABC transporter [Paenibacillus durus]|uniref:ABC transporter n=1 Tax=Paenibacillus durus TaxID=44251 RepID=A0A089HGD2_PAEDU|nr:ABC transporter [Paenibacillus durus]
MRTNKESRTGTKKAIFKRIFECIKPYWRQTLFTIIILCITSLLGVLPSIIVQQIIDRALPGKDFNLLVLLVSCSLISTVISSLLSVWQSYLSTSISQNIIYNLKNKMYRHLQEMPYHFFTTVNQGEIITRMSSDLSGIQGVFNGTIVNFVSNTLILMSTFITLMLMDWKLALLGMFALPLFVFPTKKVGNIRLKLAKQTQQQLSLENQIINETLSISGFKLMKIFNQEIKESEALQTVSFNTSRLQIKEFTAGRWFVMIMTVFTSFGPLLIYLYGGFLFIQGEISIGAIVAFVTLLARLYAPVGQLSNLYVDIVRSEALFERIFEYFDMKPQTTASISLSPWNVATHDIVFNNVNFAYQMNKPVLKNISFTAYSGKVTALVGPSGSGKTTIVNLIPRLYEINSGSINIGDEDICSLNLPSLRSKIGLVTQETYLFNGTIKENLLYAKSEATDQEIITACEAAYIHQFIMSLPEGYETLVGNRGIKLSGGEKQRISIARVLLKNPPIIIMDEATSSLDTLSEYYIQKAMNYLLKEKTSIVIAHRLSTIKNASNILVIKEGSIIGEGTHDELLKKNGIYKELCEKQFGKDFAY